MSVDKDNYLRKCVEKSLGIEGVIENNVKKNIKSLQEIYSEKNSSTSKDDIGKSNENIYKNLDKILNHNGKITKKLSLEDTIDLWLSFPTDWRLNYILANNFHKNSKKHGLIAYYYMLDDSKGLKLYASKHFRMMSNYQYLNEEKRKFFATVTFMNLSSLDKESAVMFSKSYLHLFTLDILRCKDVLELEGLPGMLGLLVDEYKKKTQKLKDIFDYSVGGSGYLESKQRFEQSQSNLSS